MAVFFAGGISAIKIIEEESFHLEEEAPSLLCSERWEHAAPLERAAVLCVFLYIHIYNRNTYMRLICFGRGIEVHVQSGEGHLGSSATIYSALECTLQSPISLSLI